MSETLIERRRRLMREEIGRIAVELFVEHGFDAVTADQISEAAGISQRTFFRYFATKDEIVLDLARRLDLRLLAALDARPASEGACTALREAFRETSRVAPGDRERVLQLANILAEAPALRARAQGERVSDNPELIKRLAHRMGVAVTDQRVRVLAVASAAAASTEFNRWAESGGRGDPSVAIVAALDMLAEGLGELDQRPRNKEI